jgi:hypothetical protein
LYHSNTLLGSIPRANGPVPHISLVFREMWDTAGPPLKPDRILSRSLS